MDCVEMYSPDSIIRISSREVTQMLGLSRHSKLLRKIDNISDSLIKSNIDKNDYWIKSSYKDSSGKNNREFLISKKGCEMLAHKCIGERGVLFTHKYMEKFQQMESILKENNTCSYQIDDPIKRAEAWIEERKIFEAIKKESELKQVIINKLEPLAIHANDVLMTNRLITSTDIAKDLGCTAQTLHRVLREYNMIYKSNRNKCWKFYSAYQHMVPEYADYEINEMCQTLKWTEKGRKYLIDLFNNNKELKEKMNEINAEKLKNRSNKYLKSI